MEGPRGDLHDEAEVAGVETARGPVLGGEESRDASLTSPSPTRSPPSGGGSGAPGLSRRAPPAGPLEDPRTPAEAHAVRLGTSREAPGNGESRAEKVPFTTLGLHRFPGEGSTVRVRAGRRVRGAAPSSRTPDVSGARRSASRSAADPLLAPGPAIGPSLRRRWRLRPQQVDQGRASSPRTPFSPRVVTAATGGARARFARETRTAPPGRGSRLAEPCASPSRREGAASRIRPQVHRSCSGILAGPRGTTGADGAATRPPRSANGGARSGESLVGIEADVRCSRVGGAPVAEVEGDAHAAVAEVRRRDRSVPPAAGPVANPFPELGCRIDAATISGGGCKAPSAGRHAPPPSGKERGVDGCAAGRCQRSRTVEVGSSSASSTRTAAPPRGERSTTTRPP